MIRCVRLWSGPDGNSHFEEGAIDLKSGPRGEVLSGRGMKLALDESRVSVEASVPPEAHKPGSALSVGIRPEHLTPGDGGLRLHVDASEVLGAEMIIHGVLRSGERLAVSLRGLHRVVPGESIGFAVDPGDVHVFDETGAAFPRSAHAKVETLT